MSVNISHFNFKHFQLFQLYLNKFLTLKKHDHHKHFVHLPRIFNKSHSQEWGYEGNCGPQTWSKNFPNAKGVYQSPINIHNHSAVFDARLQVNPLVINYYEDSCTRIKNTGHTFQVDAAVNNKSSSFSLESKFQLIFI